MKPYYEHAGIRIFHGDCRDILPGVEADATVTDPPYGTGEKRSEGGRLSSGGRIIKSRQEWDVWDPSWIELCPKPLAAFVPPKRLGEISSMGARLLVWDRGSGVVLKGISPRYTFERVGLLGRVPDTREADLFKHRGNIKTAHPHGKPEAVMRWLVRVVSTEADAILDPFMGSGTTLRAAKDLGRKAIGIELEERYCEIAAKRLAQEVFPW